jgi:hypothetical protein
MIETHTTRQMHDAQTRAHKERSDAFAAMFRALPKLAGSLRHLR